MSVLPADDGTTTCGTPGCHGEVHLSSDRRRQSRSRRLCQQCILEEIREYEKKKKEEEAGNADHEKE